MGRNMESANSPDRIFGGWTSQQKAVGGSSMWPIVLIVDDAESNHALLKFHMQDERIEVRSAYDGESALKLIADQLPDLVLLDVDMPGLDGFEVCRRLRENLFTMNVPVIFLTSAAKTSQKVRGLDLGACDYVVKPYQADELLARIRSSLRAKARLDLLSTQRVHNFIADASSSRRLPTAAGNGAAA
jgi:DNA-binding response OmpR family regulator